MRLNFHLAHDESRQQVLLRLLASCFHASDDLQIGVGPNSSKEAGLYIENTLGEKRLLLFFGAASLGRLTRACRQAEHVAVFGLEDARWQSWWTGLQNKLAALANLSVTSVDESVVDSLLPYLQNRVRWHGVLDHETLWLHHSGGISEVTPQRLKMPRAGLAQAA